MFLVLRGGRFRYIEFKYGEWDENICLLPARDSRVYTLLQVRQEASHCLLRDVGALFGISSVTHT